MKKKLLLYLSQYDYSGNVAVASTLAWLCGSNGIVFDSYYDSYHQGIHFPGGDSRDMDEGQLTGGTVSGGRHFEQFYFLLLNFDLSVVLIKDTIFSSAIHHLNVPIAVQSERMNTFYKKLFDYVGAPLPPHIVMIGSRYKHSLDGLNAYLYPEIYYRRALGVLDSIPESELADLYQANGTLYCLHVDDAITARLRSRGYNVKVIDRIDPQDDYLTITQRVVDRWRDKAKGWLLGDPTMVTHWLPKACEEDLLSLYSVPQEKILSELGDLIASKGKVVYGRQYSDRDFFKLSKHDQCLQVIDPCRPPFQSVKHISYSWQDGKHSEGLFEDEYSDETLRRFARENRVLVSLMFWSGMIREMENFYNLMDLFAITRLRCGLVITAQSYEYMMSPPLELIVTPLEQGGVHPMVEPVLGSCGIGVGIESYISKNRLQEAIQESLSRIHSKVQKESYMPRGWWPTMDTNLEKLTWREGPKPVRWLKYHPYVQIRFSNKADISGKVGANNQPSGLQHLTEKIKSAIRHAGLMNYFEAYRPYEFYRPGPIRKEVIETVKSTGLQYMFTKSGFNTVPEVKYLDDHFIAMNYTSGQWDGWTPFETINDVSDLKKSEKELLKRKKPGWIVSTIDSCLWTFGGEFWKKGSKLFDIAQFCAKGGMNGKLVNVKPHTIARYARIIHEQRLLT